MGYKIYLSEQQTNNLLEALKDSCNSDVKEIIAAIENKLDNKETRSDLPYVEEWWPDDFK